MLKSFPQTSAALSFHRLAHTRCTSSAVKSLREFDHIKSTILSPQRLGSIRSFGRKAARMGHHIQNLDEMAHESSREEAASRREDKKKKSKKARLNAQKEDTVEEAEGDNIDTSLGPTEDEFGNPVLPYAADVRSKMLMVIAAMEKSFSSVRGGEATPELFDNVRVSAYGEMVTLSTVGQVVIEDPQRATISCYDPSIANDVRDAVRDMPGMNLNPYVEEGGSGVVIIPIPRVSAETRKEIVKELSRKAENERQRLRRIRRDAMDIVKKGQNGKLEGISKDDAFRVGKEIDAATEEVLAALNVIVEKKQKSVMDD